MAEGAVVSKGSPATMSDCFVSVPIPAFPALQMQHGLSSVKPASTRVVRYSSVSSALRLLPIVLAFQTLRARDFEGGQRQRRVASARALQTRSKTALVMETRSLRSRTVAKPTVRRASRSPVCRSQAKKETNGKAKATPKPADAKAGLHPQTADFPPGTNGGRTSRDPRERVLDAKSIMSTRFMLQASVTHFCPTDQSIDASSSIASRLDLRSG